LLSILGSLGRVAESKGIGALAEHYGWNAALYGILGSVLVGIVLMSFLWNLTPKSAGQRVSELASQQVSELASQRVRKSAS